MKKEKTVCSSDKKPNILMFMVDQMRFPRLRYGKDHGFVDPLKRILGFQDQMHDSNEFRKFFPGLTALANNAVVLRNHKTASSACVPSRTALFTGQYGTKTGSVQTDGVFKDGASKKFPWVDPEAFPTLGHWMRKYGYTTHYFGKWHVSGEETTSLEAHGFADWELSCPDPHGTLPNNLGYYRDYQFEDVATAFLRRQGLGVPFSVKHAKYNVDCNEAIRETGSADDIEEPGEGDSKPWFAVCSFTNPHDIGAYPGIPSTVCDARVEGADYTLAVPPKGSTGSLPKDGTMKIPLNKQGFPQNNANVPETWDEDLLNSNKPDCQFDYRYKMGLALASKAGRLASEKAADAYMAAQENPDTATDMKKEEQLAIAVTAALSANKTGLPFALTENPELSSRAFIQYYGYMMHEMDQHLSEVLKTLEETGQADNTIVLFCADHGEYGASHGAMMEKWHSGYEEMLHVPLVARFPLSMHQVPGGLKQEDTLTSHIDLFPTILGLAGADEAALKVIHKMVEADFQKEHPIKANVQMPVGDNIAPLIRGEAEKVDRKHDGVLFITHDTITAPFASQEDEEGERPTQYEVYKAAVKVLRDRSKVGDRTREHPEEVKYLSEGSVRQPNHVNCVVDNENWKLVRYFEPLDKGLNRKLDSADYENNNQYELYDLNEDATEQRNLLIYDNVDLKVIVDSELDKAYLNKAQTKATELKALLVELEKDKL
ncbi:MAG: sulfatase-like hydrolase/transferase [Gammaproteobacteria bacterium]|nr:sulfatase-like hydrolase/transferase [Gammaproteobacteria bacterium]